MKAAVPAVTVLILVVLVSAPHVHGDVLTLETDKAIYRIGEKITFSGTEEDGGEMVTLIIRDPSGTKVKLTADPQSDTDGHYAVSPVKISEVFSAAGVYKALSVTSSQPISNATIISLDYDGKNVRVVEPYDLELMPIGDRSINEGERFSLTARITDPAIGGKYSLVNAPSGAAIDAETGRFSWTPTESQGPGAYLVDFVVEAGTSRATETVIITVNEVPDAAVMAASPQAAQNGSPDRPATNGSHGGPAGAQDGIRQPPPFVDPQRDPQHYVDRYMAEDSYREWFDGNFPQYSSIFEAVGLPEPEIGICGQGTGLVNGVCTITDEYIQSLESKYAQVQEQGSECFLFWCA